MSLLDDVSIVVTPNGYKAGELYAVIPVPTEGAEEITNGDFATDTGWSKGTGWTISGGSANCDGTQTGSTNLNPTSIPAIVNGQTYLLSLDVTLSAGTLSVFAFSSGALLSESSIGTNTLTLYFTKGAGGNLYIQGNADFTGSIDNVSVKEYTSSDMDVTRATAATRVDEDGLVNYAVASDLVTNGDFTTDSDWSEGAGWDINTTTNVAERSGETGNTAISQSISLVNGKLYKFSYTRNYVSGNGVTNIYVKLDDVSYTTLGNYSSTVVEEHTVTGTFIAGFTGNMGWNIYGIGTFTGNLDNISVKELTNVPRIDYTGGGCPHILAEPQRTNLVTYSEAYGAGTYFSGTSGSTIDNTTSVSPSGENNATQVTSTGSGKIQSGGLGLTQNTDYVLSFYAKNVDATLVNSRVYATGGSGGSNLTSVDYTSQLSTTEWTRITHSFNTGTNTTIYVYLSSALNSGGTIQVWGAQLEQASYATSYIPNFGTAAGVTRAQDVFTRDGIGSLINSTEGVLFAEMDALANDGSYRVITISDGSTSNYIALYYNPTSNNISWELKVGNAVQFSRSVSLPLGSTSFNKFAFKYKENDCKLFLNGVESDIYTSNVTFTSNTLNSLFLTNGDGILLLFGKVKQLQVYKTALDDDELELLTGATSYGSFGELAVADGYTII